MRVKAVFIVVAALLSLPGGGPAFLEAKEVWACGGVLAGGGPASGHIRYGYYMGHSHMDHGYWPKGPSAHGPYDYRPQHEYDNPYEEEYQDENAAEQNWEGGPYH